MRRELLQNEQNRLQRLQLKLNLFVQSQGKCERCKDNDGSQLHEALITRRDVQGMCAEDARRIFARENSLLLCNGCHAWLQPRRQEAYVLLCTLRGKRNVDAWLKEVRAMFKSNMQLFDGEGEHITVTMHIRVDASHPLTVLQDTLTQFMHTHLDDWVHQEGNGGVQYPLAWDWNESGVEFLCVVNRRQEDMPSAWDNPMHYGFVGRTPVGVGDDLEMAPAQGSDGGTVRQG